MIADGRSVTLDRLKNWVGEVIVLRKLLGKLGIVPMVSYSNLVCFIVVKVY
jgi:hypothetical protein